MGKPKYTPSVEAQKVTKKHEYTASLEAQEPLEDEGHVDTAKDFTYGAAQGASFNFADEAYGVGRAILEAGGGSKELPTDIYEEHRDVARAAWDEARERSPVATTVGEISGAVLSPGTKIFAAGKGLKGVLRGAAEGGLQSYGATDKEDVKGQIVDAGKGAAIGGAVGALTNFATQRFSKSANAIRSEVLGVKPKDYRVDGPGDRKKIVERITETGMLKNRKAEYDVDSGKFKTTGKSKFQIDEIEANTEERLLGRADDAIEKLQTRKEERFGMLLDGRFVPASAIDDMAGEIADEYSKRGLLKGPMARNAAVEKIRENILDQVMNLGGDMSRLSLRQVDQLKRMAQEDVRNFSKGLGELGDNDELARITARKLKNLVEDNIGGGRLSEEFKKLNSSQHDFLSVKGDLKNKIASLELAAPGSSQVNKTSVLEAGVDGLLGGSQGRLDSAARREWYENVIPKPVRAVIPYAVEEAPGAIYRQNFQGNETRGNWRNPSSVENIPEQLIRTPLPRTTEELVAKKPFVLAKIAQMMPDMFDAVKDVFENNPENLPELAQVISLKMPHVFEKDKYNRFDGRIVSEVDKQKAIKDTLLKKDISSIEQAKIITRLNEEGLFEG